MRKMTREERKLRRMNIACIVVWAAVLVAVLIRWILGI